MGEHKRWEKKKYSDLRLIPTLGPHGMPRYLALILYRRARKLCDSVRGVLEVEGIFYLHADIIYIVKVAVIEVHLLA